MLPEATKSSLEKYCKIWEEALPRNQQLLPKFYRSAMKAGEQHQNFTLVQLSTEDDEAPFLGEAKILGTLFYRSILTSNGPMVNPSLFAISAPNVHSGLQASARAIPPSVSE